MHAALKLQCGRVTGNKKFTIGGLTCHATAGIVFKSRVISLLSYSAWLKEVIYVESLAIM